MRQFIIILFFFFFVSFTINNDIVQKSILPIYHNELTENWPFDKLGESFKESQLLVDELIFDENNPENVNTFNNDTESWKLPHVVDADVRMYKKRGISQSTLYY